MSIYVFDNTFAALCVFIKQENFWKIRMIKILNLRSHKKIWWFSQNNVVYVSLWTFKLASLLCVEKKIFHPIKRLTRFYVLHEWCLHEGYLLEKKKQLTRTGINNQALIMAKCCRATEDCCLWKIFSILKQCDTI